MESAVGAFAWRCSLLLPSGSEHRTDHVGPRWVSFAAKVQYLSRTAQPGPPSPWMAKWKGQVSCLKVFYKKSFLKQYNKAGLVLRLEVCVNDPRDFRIGKSLVHLDYLGLIAYHA